MAYTFTKNHLHVVFSTKQRIKLIAQDFQERLWAISDRHLHNIDLIPVAVGGMRGHVHMIFHAAQPGARRRDAPAQDQFVAVDE